ncbi:hypothetical protein CWATWH0402_2373 [Crocosphaera watsonii WH 0402]|uniref:Uncharacterized protein n=1 Tax=Crocosphaera watsonii WH 0402 TaxID=1284629 RepID=T2JMB7_CROWT|nr:hypothetical protein [Crocosphaera watsonii]CCQ66194.1 hypothetical protein CWATWH0402_2373 [Crocosphaera watsonii WH 0402]
MNNTFIFEAASNQGIFSFPAKYNLSDQDLENSKFGGMTGQSCGNICGKTNHYSCGDYC